jgi:hypothetical protein
MLNMFLGLNVSLPCTPTLNPLPLLPLLNLYPCMLKTPTLYRGRGFEGVGVWVEF